MASSSSSGGGRSTNADLRNSLLFDVSHVTAVVTGGATGIGLMITQALVANGAKVYITGRRQEKLDQTVRLYGEGEGRLLAIAGDVSTKEGCVRLAEEIEKREPEGIQLLVNNAGIARDEKTSFAKNGEPDSSSAEAISKHFLNSTDDAWASTFQTNVTAQYFTSMAFLPLLARGGTVTPGYSSSVVNVSSISGAMKGSSMGQFSYASSKAASTHLSRMLATMFKDVKVRVNVIAPGVFPSEMTAGESDEQNKSSLDMRSYNPAGRKGHDSDMAATILFLAGKGGVFYNEQILYPDGGNTLTVPAQK
ncbi:NAD(P)-binding protein [Dissoconium aciculare CBS 342.82]|uniref:NAD(P)-binding protein n=1 Tax=Dissoconium aciculare CBS 342.82 TaxID=1314786 RepID=A0A6J3MD69_9PEZI|nr:NAD(P)-binding protein [Dissoconium aciculare CBS 342.82]KAF1825828.1 NAD(P)-binding protein [Dissoconium aciculare CBS 342.82]